MNLHQYDGSVAADLTRKSPRPAEEGRIHSRMAAIFKILADPARLTVVSSLLEAELCVGDISQTTHLPQSSVSHHLKALREADLVRWKRAGKKIFYRIADSHVTALLAVARDHARESL